MKKITAALSCLVVALTCSASAQVAHKPIKATYFFFGLYLVDPPPDQKKDHLYLWMEGKGAKAIYDAIPEPPHIGCELRDLEKSAGGLACVKTGNEYFCYLGIKLDTGELTGGYVC